jgi:hypothetical protein
MLHLKQEQAKPKTSRRKIIKVRAQSGKIEIKKTLKINETKTNK